MNYLIFASIVVSESRFSNTLLDRALWVDLPLDNDDLWAAIDDSGRPIAEPTDPQTITVTRYRNVDNHAIILGHFLACKVINMKANSTVMAHVHSGIHDIYTDFLIKGPTHQPEDRTIISVRSNYLHDILTGF